jgi:NDP-sugar pyrophosphorylase family protein
MKAMILAAGEGTRLWPLTERQPKPIVPVLNQPLLAHTLSLLSQFGIDQAVVNLHHRAPRTVSVLGDGAEWGVSLVYSEEERLLGTAGAVKRAERYFDAPFLVLYGDNLFDVDLGALIQQHSATGAACTIGLFRAPDPTAVGMVETDSDGRVLRFVEKPPPDLVTTDWANAGVYVLDPALLATMLAEQPLDFGRDMFPQWLAAGVPVFACPVDGLLQDIGTPAGYLAAHRAGLDGRTPRLETGWRTGIQERAPGIWAAPSVRLDGAAELVAPSLLGDGCVVEQGTRIGPYAVLGPKCRVGMEACVKNSVMWYCSTVESGALLEDVILASGSVVGAGAVLRGGTIVGEEARVPPGARPPLGARIQAKVQD